jgi:hypothetical protein
MSTRASLVFTNQRIIFYNTHFNRWSGKPKNIEIIEEHSWRDLKSASIDISSVYSDIKFETVAGKIISVNNIVKDNANKISAIVRGLL